MSGFDKQIPSMIAEYELYDVHSGDELLKVANDQIELPDNFVFDPDYLYLWVRIVSAGEYYGPNKNGDYFPEEELLKYYGTFGTAHAFKNHENKRVEEAIGEVLSVRWNPIMKGVEIFKGIDKKRAPEIARGFLKGYLTDVSMGCKVPYTICSICGNKARKRSEFCDHVNKHRMQYLGNGERVFEINYEPNFHDSSTVLTGAERVAKAFFIIDTPPPGTKVSFQKVAGGHPGVSRYIKLSEAEMNKVAHHQSDIHPLLIAAQMEKVASPDVLHKLAELEKEVTGKLLNIVSAPDESKVESAEQMIDIIKFLTDKRMDSDTLSTIGQTLSNLAASEGISPQRVFSIFLGVAELLGIELYPSELHAILSEMTDAKLNTELQVSDGSGDELMPTEYARGIKQTLEATDQLPDFDSPADLFAFYNEGAHQTDFLRGDPVRFMEHIRTGDNLDDNPPVHVVKIIRQTLTPMMPVRSTFPEHILPRLSTILSGFQPTIGGGDARRDFDILANPKTLGDMLATFAYRNYQHMRPQIVRTKLIRLAMQNDRELEKVAADPAPMPGGIKRRYLLMFGVPAIYGASAFQKSRREHGRNLSDAENFVADRPGLISTGVVMGGKPLSRALGQGGVKLLRAGKAVKDKVVGKMTAEAGTDINKLSYAAEYEDLVKLADSFSSGQFNAFGEDTLVRFANESGFTPEETAALKVATVFSVVGMDKEAQQILEFYQLPTLAKGMLLKTAADVTRDEMDKAANDFANNMLLDGLIIPHSLTTTLPGRVVDAMVISKLTKKLGDQSQSAVPQPEEAKA